MLQLCLGSSQHERGPSWYLAPYSAHPHYMTTQSSIATHGPGEWPWARTWDRYQDFSGNIPDSEFTQFGDGKIEAGDPQEFGLPDILK